MIRATQWPCDSIPSGQVTVGRRRYRARIDLFELDHARRDRGDLAVDDRVRREPGGLPLEALPLGVELETQHLDPDVRVWRSERRQFGGRGRIDRRAGLTREETEESAAGSRSAATAKNGFGVDRSDA